MKARWRRSITVARLRRSSTACHTISEKVRLFVSYHCSRYNTNTGVLTPKMFQDVFAAARAYLDSDGARAPAKD